MSRNGSTHHATVCRVPISGDELQIGRLEPEHDETFIVHKTKDATTRHREYRCLRREWR